MSTPTAEQRARARAKYRAKGIAPDDPRHGNWTIYSNGICKCERCLNAFRAYKKVKRRRARRVLA